MRLAVLVLLTSALPVLAHAGEEDLAGHTLAMGGAATALPSDNAAIGVNPAALALDERYDVHGHAAAGGGRGWNFCASVVDSRTSAVAFGLSYSYRFGDVAFTDDDLPGWIADGELPTNVKRTHTVGVGLAVPFADRRVAVGIGGAVRRYDHDRNGDVWTGDLDVALAATPAPGLTLGLAARDLLPFDHPDDPDPVLVGGVGYQAGPVRLAGDLGVLLETGDLRGALGIEAAVDIVRVRTGWRAGEAPALTWGLGVLNEQGGFDYAMAIPLDEPLTVGGLTHVLSFRLFM